MTRVRLGPATPWSRVKHSTTEPLRDINEVFRPLVKSATQNIIVLFLNQTYVVGTQKNRLDETILFSSQKHMLKLMGKKIFTILLSKMLLI